MWVQGGESPNAYLITLGSFFYQSCIVGFVVLGFMTHHTEELAIELTEEMTLLPVPQTSQLFRFWLHLRGIHSLDFPHQIRQQPVGHDRVPPHSFVAEGTFKNAVCCFPTLSDAPAAESVSAVDGSRALQNIHADGADHFLLKLTGKLLIGHGRAEGCFKSVESLEVFCGHWFQEKRRKQRTWRSESIK